MPSHVQTTGRASIYYQKPKNQDITKVYSEFAKRTLSRLTLDGNASKIDTALIDSLLPDNRGSIYISKPWQFPLVWNGYLQLDLGYPATSYSIQLGAVFSPKVGDYGPPFCSVLGCRTACSHTFCCPLVIQISLLSGRDLAVYTVYFSFISTSNLAQSQNN